MSRYRKLIAALGGFAGVVASTLSDGEITATDVQSIVVAGIAAFFVWRLPNKPEPEPPA